jgi:cbb3-type cytochrome oxidase maturation protein
MTALFWLIPLALLLGLTGLIAFFWSVRDGQFDDPEGDSSRILTDEDHPIVDD